VHSDVCLRSQLTYLLTCDIQHSISWAGSKCGWVETVVWIMAMMCLLSSLCLLLMVVLVLWEMTAICSLGSVIFGLFLCLYAKASIVPQSFLVFDVRGWLTRLVLGMELQWMWIPENLVNLCISVYIYQLCLHCTGLSVFTDCQALLNFLC